MSGTWRRMPWPSLLSIRSKTLAASGHRGLKASAKWPWAQRHFLPQVLLSCQMSLWKKVLWICWLHSIMDWNTLKLQTCTDIRRHAQTCGCAKMRVPSNHPFKINHLNSILHYEPSSNLPRSWDPDFDSSSVSRPISSETCRMDVKASGLWSSKKKGLVHWHYCIFIYTILYIRIHIHMTYDYFILFHTITI